MDKDRRAARAAALNMQRRQMVEECRGQLQQLGQGGAGSDKADSGPQREDAGDPTTLIGGDAGGELVAEFEGRWQLAMMTVLSTTVMSEQPREDATGSASSKC